MSGCSYETSCPNCNNEVSEYSDHKPFGVTIVGPCLNCGFYTTVNVHYLNLEELNEARDQQNIDFEYEGEDMLLPLLELPEQDESL